MGRIRVKICGICRPQDAVAAATAGADAIGIMMDSRAGRFVSADNAGQILAAIPPFVSTTALFMDAGADEIKKIIRELPFSAVQLHGDETPEMVADLKPIRVIKVLHVATGDSAILRKWKEAIGEFQLTNLIGVLVESARPAGPRGGSGIASDFMGLSEMQAAGEFRGLPPMTVAGGLTPENVGEAIRLLHPYAVDVSSGVESGHREKSASRIEAFVQAARRGGELQR
jgi:phosphoribosylanthranilate isomerase